MKNKHGLGLAMVLSAMLILITPAIAFQQAPGVSVSIADVNPRGFPEMTATVAVLDLNGLTVPNLTKESFRVFEDTHGASMLDAKAQVNTDAPIAVCLAIDISSSMAEQEGKPIQDAKAAAIKFIDESLGPKDKACVVAFNDRVNTDTPLVFDPAKELDFTNDKNALKNLINALVADQPSTPLYDAALKAIKITATQPSGARAVILFTDGKDERLSVDGTQIERGSVAVPDRPITAARDAHIPVFTIGLGKAIDATYLQRLAEETGGRYQQTPTLDRLGELFGNIATQLKTQYMVKYISTLTPDNKDHTLQIGIRTTVGEAESRATTFRLPLPDKPYIQLYYVEGTERKSLLDGQKLKAVASIEPSIATSGVVSFASYAVDRTAVYTTTVAPWTFAWNTCALTPGAHTLTVRAQDDRGAASDKNVTVEIVPGEFIECVVLPSNENKILVGGIALLAILFVGLAIWRMRPRSKTCPRGLHIMPIDAIECLDCAELDRQTMAQATAAAMSAMQTTQSPPTPQTTQALPSSESAPAAPLSNTVALKRPVEALAFLVMERGTHPGKEFVLHADTKLGRAGDNDIVLDDTTAGRHQAKIKEEGKDWFLYDLAATNPTAINGHPVQGRRKLTEDDRIQMGQTIFVFKRAR